MFRFVDSSGGYMAIYYLIYIPFVSTFLFHSKSKKIMSNFICSVAIRDHKCKVASIYRDSREPPLPFNFHPQSEKCFGPCWLDFKKRKKKKSELERVSCLHLSRELPNSTLAAVKWFIYRWYKKLAGSYHLEFLKPSF